MKDIWERNKEAIIAGLIGGLFATLIFAGLTFFVDLPDVEVPAWLLIAIAALGVSTLILVRTPADLKPVVRKKFGAQRVYVDGKSFVKCEFRGTELVYLGSRPFSMENSDLDSCSIAFEGSAADFLSALATIYRNDDLRPVVESKLMDIRSGSNES